MEYKKFIFDDHRVGIFKSDHCVFCEHCIDLIADDYGFYFNIICDKKHELNSAFDDFTCDEFEEERGD